MRYLSPALKHVVFPVLSRSGYLRYTAGDGPVVVTYHGVFPPGYEFNDPALDGNLVHADSLRQQLKLLKKRYHVISPEDFLRWADGKMTLPPRSILLTCDDALQNTLTEMAPILQDFGLSGLFFATATCTDGTPSMLWYEELYLMLLSASETVDLEIPEADIRIGTAAGVTKHAYWWNLVERLSRFDGELRHRFLDQVRDQLRLSDNWRTRFVQNPTLASRYLLLDLPGLRQLAAKGMSIGAHSLSHPILAHASDDLAWREISESRRVLEKGLGQAVWAFGYPFGNSATVTGRDVRLAEQAGFRCAFTNVEGRLDAEFNRFAIPRIHVSASMSLAEFEAHIVGFYRSLRARFLGAPEPNIVVGV